jgi:hypothetical protein
MKPAPPKLPADSGDDTGLPGFHSWKSVYVFVLVSFAVWVGLLILLASMFE